MNKTLNRTCLLFVALLSSANAQAYQVDKDVRNAVSKAAKKELIEATPKAQRFSVRLSFSPKGAFREYERIAKEAGFAPYADCSIATFVAVTNWRLLTERNVSPLEIAGAVSQCERKGETVLGPKPLSQADGDREILRGIWQRNLEFVAKSLGDGVLDDFLRADATARFSTLYSAPSQWTLSEKGFVKVTAKAAATTALQQGTPAPSMTPQPSTGSSTSGAIERIALRTVTRYGLSGVYVENETYLLLSDGSIRRNFSDNPYTLNVPTSKRLQPQDWGRWRARGDALEVTWPGKKTTQWKTWFSTRPATNNQRINGRFQSADGFGGGRVANFNTVAFSSDGRFSWATLKGGSTGAWLPAYSDKRRAGRYELDGYAIKLRYNDGAVETYAFCFYPKDNEHFVIGSSHFTVLN